MNDSYDNIFIYYPLVRSHQGLIDYIEPKSTWFTNMVIPSNLPSMITPADNHQYPHLIPLDDYYVFIETHLHITIDIQPVPPPPIKYPTNEPSEKTLHKKSVEPLSIRTLNLIHMDATNLPPVPPSSTLAPCKNMTQFESLILHRIFGFCKFRNQNHLTAVTNASLVNSGLLQYTIGSFATAANPPQSKTNQEPTSVPW